MAVDNVQSAESQARLLAQKRRELEDEKNQLEIDRSRAERERMKAATQAKEKTDRQLVEISKAGENQAELVKKMNSDRVKSLNENTQKSYLAIAEKTAEELRKIDANAIKSIQDHRLGTMEKLQVITDQSLDPFYRLKSLNPVLSEGEREFTIKVAMAEHEAQNLFVSGEGQSVKLSLARRFQEQAKDETGDRLTKTSSFQTVVETLNLPGPFDPKGIQRDYADGVVTLRIPKAGIIEKTAAESAVKPS